MKRIIIAMSDRHQSQKLAIVLSNSYDSIIINTPAKLEAHFNHLENDLFTIIFENTGSEDFTPVVNLLYDEAKLKNPVIQITKDDITNDDSFKKFILKKPFGVKELLKAFSELERQTSSSESAIA